jgi:hypothetical protein
MKKVVFRGPVMTQSGYGVHSRQVARWLLQHQDLDVKFMVTPWGDTPWILDRHTHNGLIGKIMDRTVGADYKADVSFQLQLPNEWDEKIAPKNVGITAAIETDKANPEWVQCCNKMNAVVFPSLHAKNSITNVGNLESDVHVIAESFDDSILNEVSSLQLPKLDTSFNFLLFGQLTGNNPYNDRKNLLFTLKWIFEAFENDRDVGILIKTNSGRNTKIDRNLILKVLNTVVKEARKGPYPRVHLLHGDMSDSDVVGLYKNDSVKALVTLTRGEGYGLPILEAAASGLPVIATNWSGHLDFMQHTKFIPVDYKLVPVHQSRIDNKIFMSNSKWAEASESDFKKKIVKFKNSPSIPTEWAREGSKTIKEKFNFEKVSDDYEQALGHFLK